MSPMINLITSLAPSCTEVVTLWHDMVHFVSIYGSLPYLRMVLRSSALCNRWLVGHIGDSVVRCDVGFS